MTQVAPQERTHSKPFTAAIQSSDVNMNPLNAFKSPPKNNLTAEANRAMLTSKTLTPLSERCYATK